MKPLNSRPQLQRPWYPTTTQYTSLQLRAESIPCPGNSPQTSNGPLPGTPFQVSKSIAEIGDAPSRSSLVHRGGSPILHTTPTISAKVLGLVLPERQKSSPLGILYQPSSKDLYTPVYTQEGQNSPDIAHWNDSDTVYRYGVDTSYGYYYQAPLESQSRFLSHSDEGSADILSTPSPGPSSEGSPFGPHCPLPVPRSSSPPPLKSTDSYNPPQQISQRNNQDDYAYVQSNTQIPALSSSNNIYYKQRHSPQQGVSPAQTYRSFNSSSFPISNASKRASPALIQARVGTENTRSKSNQRRTKTDKSLFICDVPGCEATLTSKYNFNCHMNSHYGIKPHACGQGRCQKSFGTMAGVKRHLLSCMRFRELLVLRQVNRDIRQLVCDVIRQRIYRILKDFTQDPPTFLKMMRDTGSVISGSSTLILISDAWFVPGDIDIYVPANCEDTVLAHLKAEGYRVVNDRRIKQHHYSQQALCRALRLSREIVETPPVVNVLIVRHSDAMSPILNFDFSFVMNAITGHGVISLFPRMTLDKRGIINQDGHTSNQRIAKYLSRGFKFQTLSPPFNINSAIIPRSIKDRYSMFVPIMNRTEYTSEVWYMENEKRSTWGIKINRRKMLAIMTNAESYLTYNGDL
ncbi:hypothetical protein NP233_g2707 [Leucocoprinus birnbaumii]|uniref:C2H2-type domain-containing protein n=1 Tax=Leucocoprinus birnbaumii TaxID=56174 RepID=A0AAD5YTG2_9AGAR|nr:hypothetical protein NP233_g2707 [Leucocoprinus birnbaumii]